MKNLKNFIKKAEKPIDKRENVCYNLYVAIEGGALYAHAPLAQLVEQLTLNQWVPGSSP